jgi:hypothetical protein
MMKIRYITLIILSLILFSCEEEVVLDLGKIQKRLVVEAKVTNDSPMVKVSLSYSQDFYDVPEYQLLTNASVVLEGENGESETLTVNSENIFESKSLNPHFGENYTLKINVDNQNIEVTTKLPPPVKITSVAFVPNPFRKNQDSLNAFVSVADQVGVDNYYRLRVNKYGKKPTGEYYLTDDSFGKDGLITMPVYFKNFTYGDTVIVELYNLNEVIYNYYSGLSENINGSFNSIAPGNPVSNMPDNVYGFFAGYAIDRDTVVVKMAMPF